MGVIIGRGGKAIHIEGPGGGGDATLCGMGADYIKGTDAAVTCKKCLAKRAKLETQAPELHPSQVREITHNCGTCGPRSCAGCGWCYDAYPDGSRKIPASDLVEHVVTFAEVRTGDIVGSLSDGDQSAWWTVTGLSDDGSRVHLVSWDGTSMGYWARGDLVTVLRRVEPASGTQDTPIMAQRASETPSRPYSGRGKRKGCKWDRRRSNSRMRKVARA